MSSVNAASSNQVMPQAQVVPVSELNGSSATLSNSSKAAPKSEASVEKATELDKDQLQQAVDVMNQAVMMDQRSLSFSVDDLSGRSIIKVKDLETEELIRQIPTEEILKVAQDIKRLQEEMGQSLGLLIDKRV
jgi:flagellar protein FlaG